MNFREVDYKISNFMVKVTDPQWVDAVKQVFDHTEGTELGNDKAFVKYDEDQQIETALLMDSGQERQSVILDKARQMADSLAPGDEFVLISQYPPLKMMFGDLLGDLQEKARQGAHGSFLMSPEENLHPFSRRASRRLQGMVDKAEELNPNLKVTNLARQTHAKAFLIKRSDGQKEVLFGSHNFIDRSVRHGTKELAMWTKDPAIVDQIEAFLQAVENE
jgi:hypothetical protein